jgi:hypothetical protein
VVTVLQGIAITADGGSTPYLFELSSAADLQTIVGGHLEVVKLEGLSMFCNEDGKLLDLPYNHFATQIFRKHLPEYRISSEIVGDVVLFGSVNEKGQFQRLPAEIIDLLIAAPMDGRHYFVEVKFIHRADWYRHLTAYGYWWEAYEASFDLERDFEIIATRVAAV